METLKNLRDLGGLPAGKAAVRHGLLYRSEELKRSSAADLERLQSCCGIKAIIDFRCAAERREAPDPPVAGAKSYWFPILREETLGITRREKADSFADFMNLLHDPSFSAADYMAGLYRTIAEDSQALEQYRLFLELLAENPGPALWHCSAGKDRAGVGTALVLSALKVERSAIMADYLLTNYCTAAIIRSAAEQALPDEPALQETFCTVMQVQESYLEAFFGAMDAAGGPEAYLQEKIGVSGATIARLQTLYLEERP